MQRRRLITLAIVAVVVLVVGGWLWANSSVERWVEVSQTDMRLAVGASQQLTVALKYKPRFRTRGGARSVAGTIQLISFPSSLDVTPTSVVTSAAAPEAVVKVTALKAGEEELVFAASNTPAEQRSWETTSTRVVVTK